MSLTADAGVTSSIPARYHTFVEIVHEIISTVLVNCLFKLAQEKVWLGELTVRPAMTIAVDLGRKATKHTKIQGQLSFVR